MSEGLRWSNTVSSFWDEATAITRSTRLPHDRDADATRWQRAEEKRLERLTQKSSSEPDRKTVIAP